MSLTADRIRTLLQSQEFKQRGSSFHPSLRSQFQRGSVHPVVSKNAKIREQDRSSVSWLRLNHALLPSL